MRGGIYEGPNGERLHGDGTPLGAPPGPPAPDPLTFFRRCWDRARGGADVEGTDVQDWGEELGLLTKVVATAPCGADCFCEEYYGEFPTDCYRPVEAGAAVPALRDTTFQRLWTKYAALPQYDKAEWTAAFNEIWSGAGSA